MLHLDKHLCVKHLPAKTRRHGQPTDNQTDATGCVQGDLSQWFMVVKDQHLCKQELISIKKKQRPGFWTLPVRVVGLKDKYGPLGTKGICDRRGKARCTGPQAGNTCAPTQIYNIGPQCGAHTGKIVYLALKSMGPSTDR